MQNSLNGLSIPQALALAQQFKRSEKYNESGQILSQILAKQAGNSQAALELARIYHQHGHLNQACNTLESATSHGASGFELYYMLGALQHVLGFYNAAEINVKKAIKLNGNSAEAFNILGSNFNEQHQTENALNAFLQSIKLAPNSADAHNNIAWVYRALGKKEQAITHFETAIKVDPMATEALSGLMMLKTFSSKEKEFGLVENLLKDTTLNTKQRTDLEFSLGKAYEDIEDFSQAFNHFNKGNSTWRKALTYNIKEDEVFFAAIKTLFTKDFIEDSLSAPETPPTSNRSPSNNEVCPIFVLGMPRSSTTLIEQILASHSLVSGAGELGYLNSICLSGPKKLTWNEKLSSDEMQQAADSYLEQLAIHSQGKPNVTDKMPFNFALIGAILKLFPNAKIIHCRRQPMDTCLSLFKHHFPMSNHTYSYKLEELGQYYNLYEDLMDHWHAVAPGRIFDIQYENVIQDVEPEVRKMLEYCKLPFEQACLDFHLNKRIVRTASSEQVRQGLYSKAAGRWKQYEQQLAPLKANLRSYS